MEGGGKDGGGEKGNGDNGLVEKSEEGMEARGLVEGRGKGFG